MRKIIYILLGCLFSLNAFSQADSLSSTTEQKLENLTEATEAETEDDSYLQSLMQFRRNRINLNTAEASDLQDLKILSDLQIQNLLRYRQVLGSFINIYELQAVPTIDIQTIQRMLPYVRADNALPLTADLKQRFTEGRHSILIRTQQLLETADGYNRADSIANRYAGSPQRLFFRYKYSYRNLLQFGLTGDKDAGEQFFKGAQSKGFDFYSFHLFARKIGPIKLLALGDFTVNLGQGLIHWQSLAFKKSPDITAVKRQADVLRPYNSAGEYNFQRGIGITAGRRNIEFTAFASIRNLDASFNIDTSLNNEDFISSILNTGYHRTATETGKKNKVQQTSFGGNVSYNNNSFHLGINGVAFKFSAPLQKDSQPYNMFAVQGDNWHNVSIDYSYTYKNFHFFGEAAIDKNGSKAFLNGLLASLDPKIDASLVYRNIEQSYQALYGNAFTESTFPSNEKGLFAGISIKPFALIKIDGYADVFSFPWLRFRVDAPSKGSEYLLQVTYSPNRQVEVYSRYKNEDKAINVTGLQLATRPVYKRPRNNWRTQISYKVNRELLLSNRVEVIWFDPREKDRSEQGFLAYTDVGYKPFGKPFSVNGRLEYFETDGFNSRIYAFESDVLYSYSIPALQDEGLRYYLNLNYSITKKLTGWFRFAQTIYQGKTSIGSGLDKINGNKRSEVKLQLLYEF